MSPDVRILICNVYKEFSNNFLKKLFNFLFFKNLKYRTIVNEIQTQKIFQRSFHFSQIFSIFQYEDWRKIIIFICFTNIIYILWLTTLNYGRNENFCTVFFCGNIFFTKFLTKFLNKIDVLKGRIVSSQNHDSTYTYTRFPILHTTSWKINIQNPYQIP